MALTPRDQQRADEDGIHLGAVLRPESLRGQSGGAGAQEIEDREDDVEDDGADRDAPDQRRLAEPSDGGGVDDPDQRQREVGERHRHGEAEDRAVRHREGTDGGGRRSHSGERFPRPPNFRSRMSRKIGTTISAPIRRYSSALPKKAKPIS